MDHKQQTYLARLRLELLRRALDAGTLIVDSTRLAEALLRSEASPLRWLLRRRGGSSRR
jgi:anti-sigma28 factor (negative regulator of flagellin synthesis)